MGKFFYTKLLSMIFVTTLVLVQCGCTNALNFRHAYDRGVTAYNEKDYDTAIIEFNNALNYKADSYSTLCLLATSYAYNKDERMAERTFQDAIRLFPDEWNAYVLYADLKRAQHDYTSAIDFYETAITLGSMGGKQKAYYKKVLKEIAIEEAAYDEKSSFASDVSKENFKNNINKNAKRKFLEKQKDQLNRKTDDVLLSLDTNKWEKVLDQKVSNGRVIEYGLKGEDIKNFNWTQLITVQQTNLKENYQQSLKDYYKKHIASVESIAKNSGKTFECKILSETSNEILYEWKFDNSKESEIARIVYTNKGIYHIHFAKKGAFTDAEKTNYKELLMNATIRK